MRRLQFLAVMVGLGLSAASCADPSNSFYIRSLGVPDTENSCLIKADTELLNPSWDMQSGGSYVAAFNVESVVRARKTDLNADPNSIRIEEIEVHLLAPNGSEINAYTMPASGFVPSSTDGVTPSTATFSAAVIPASAASALTSLIGQYVTVEVTPRGHTLGTTKVESGPFSFNVSLLPLGSLQWTAAECSSPTSPAVTDPCTPGSNGGKYCPTP